MVNSIDTDCLLLRKLLYARVAYRRKNFRRPNTISKGLTNDKTDITPELRGLLMRTIVIPC